MGCQRLTYHKTFSPLKVAYNRLNLSERTCVGDYRYGFQGQEKDDEVKKEGNSIDFGARMYDPRVGRWLSRDKLEGKKPFLTPYQAFKNNPIVFIDPDGNDEFLTTIIKLNDGTTHRIENDRGISQKFIADKARSTMNLFAVQKFRDIRTTVTYTQDENGVFTKSRTSVAEGDVKFFKEYIFPYDRGTIVDFGPFSLFGDGEKQQGGFRLTSEDGGDSSTKTISENDVESRDIGALLDALGGLKNGSLGNDTADKIKDVVDIVQDINDLVPVDGSSGGTGEGNSEGVSGSSETDSDTTIHINQWEHNGGYTINHVKDTTVKKSEVKNVNQNREYNGN